MLPSTVSFLHSCWFQHLGKGYSVLLFEVDICIIRLGWVIVRGLSPITGCSRGERVLSTLTMEDSLRLLPSSQPCSCIPHTRAAGQPRLQSTLGLAVAEGRKTAKEEGTQERDGSGRAGVELRYLNMQSVNWL